MTFSNAAPGGQIITATATDILKGDTSEFSGFITVSTSDIDLLANWFKNLQYTNPSHDSDGAIKVHHSPGYIAPNGDVYFRVIPYFSNLGVRGLLQAPVVGKLEVAEKWINWYLNHLNMSGTPPGVVYDHWYLEDGSGAKQPARPVHHLL